MDIEKSLNDSKHPGFNFIYQKMPNYLSSKHRVHRMFLKRCDSDINQYQTCIEDSNWKSNIDKYISEKFQKKCYKEWVKVRKCATKHMGDSFSMKINISRELEPLERTKDDILEKYERLIETKVDMLKELSSGEEEEEAAEGEASEEEASEEGEASEEETSENKTDEETSENKEDGEEINIKVDDEETTKDKGGKDVNDEEKDNSTDNNSDEDTKEDKANVNTTAAIKDIQKRIPINKDIQQLEQEDDLREKRIKRMEDSGVKSSDVTPINFHDANTEHSAEDDRHLSTSGQGTTGGGLNNTEVFEESNEMAKAKDAELVKHPENAKELNRKEIR